MVEPGRDGPIIADERVDRAIIGALRGQDLSGFEIWHWLGSEEGVPGHLTEARLYPTLYRLEAEGLLQSDWREGERTRRRYRLTARALVRAQEHNWPPLAFRGDHTADGAARAAEGAAATPSPGGQVVRRPSSPDPEAGGWIMPPKAAASAPTPEATILGDPGDPGDPGAAGTAVRGRADRRDTARVPAPGADTPARREADRPGTGTIAAYADGLAAGLDLPRREVDRVRQEIADHLADSTRALVQHGREPAAAAAEATGRLGPAHDLALMIEHGQQSPDRVRGGFRRGAIELVAELVLWLLLSVSVLVLAPGIADFATGLSSLVGLHLVVLRSAEWATNQVAITLCVGAFAAGRMSMGQLIRVSRTGTSLRRRWAIGGAIPLLVVVLLLPGFEDALTVLTLLAVPVAFVAGTYRPQQHNDRAYSIRGVGAGLVVVLAVTFLPFGRLFLYDPGATPDAPPVPGQSVELTIYELGSGTFEYELLSSSAVGVVTVELWPASTDGLFVVVDKSASAPVLSVKPGTPSGGATAEPIGAEAVDFAKLPRVEQWWTAAVAKTPDGHRTGLAMLIQMGAPPNLSSALGWLISKL